jgi:predicted NBD/HSP70 family sugar kinase
MFIGIDWGGTKIEGIALTQKGQEIIRLREETPHHDYHGCIRVIAGLIERIERETGQRSPDHPATAVDMVISKPGSRAEPSALIMLVIRRQS